MAETSVYLNVHDASTSLPFYESLGFKVNERHEADNGHLMYAELDRRGAKLSLGEIAANEDPDFQAWASDPLGQGVLVSFTVPDIEDAWEAVQQGDVEVEQPYTEDEEMGAHFSIVDPDGYSLMFWQEPDA